MRKVSSPAWGIAVAALLGASTAGCEQIGMLKAKMAFKDANNFYSSGNYRAASAKYLEAIEQGCHDGVCTPEEISYSYFFLANSYDSMYRPGRKGEPENDELLPKAVDYYTQAAERSPDPEYRKRALQYMAAVYGAEKLNDPARAEPIVQQLIELDPDDLTNYYQIAKLYEDAGQFEQAEAQLLKARDIQPDSPDVYAQLARFYGVQGNFEKQIEALKMRADKDPQNPEFQQFIAATYWTKACVPPTSFCEGASAPDNLKPRYIQEGLDAVDKALAIRQDYYEALIYKNLLLRSQAHVAPVAQRDALIKQAEALMEQAAEVQARQKGEAAAAIAAGGSGPSGG